MTDAGPYRYYMDDQSIAPECVKDGQLASVAPRSCHHSQVSRAGLEPATLNPGFSRA